MTEESPGARRARRLAEARAQRGTPERQAQVEALLRAKAEAAAAARPTRSSSGSRSSTGTRAPRAPRAPKPAPDPASLQPGHALPVWMAMRGVALAHLDACAKAHRLTTAGEVWQLVKDSRAEELGDPRYQLPKLLDYVVTKSLQDHGLLASALIVDPARGDEPGPDFFRTAVKRGQLDAAHAPPLADAGWTMTDDQRAFWDLQVESLYARFP